jgi:hypothetical protein
MKAKPFRIFRAGKHTDSSGSETEFTREQLAATVKAYNDGDWRAPLVAGHPKGHAPAYGWVGKMRLDDDGAVWVDAIDQLNPDFAELMKAGAYRNRSASWYSPDHPNNPTPGVWQLRHLGMLGAQPPALKGLGDVEFGDGEGITVEFADYGLSSVASILRSLRELFIGKFGLEDADKALPNFLISDIEQAGRDRIAETTPNFTDTEDGTMTPEQIAELQAKAARAAELEQQNATLAATNATLTGQVQSFSERDATARKAAALLDAKAALQPLVASGKLLPAQLEQAANFMVGLDDSTKSYEFGDATGDNALTARGFFTALLAAAPAQVDYAEHTGDVAALPASMKPTQLADKAREYQDAQAAKGIVITSTQAVNAVLAGTAT